MQSRLSRSLEQKTKKRFFLTIIGTIVILFLLLRYGLPAVINLSLFLNNVRTTHATEKINSKQFVAIPVLDPIVSATNSATIDVSGTATAKQQIKLFTNDTFTDTVDTKDNGSFVFKNVTLQQGDNTIKIKAEQNNNESDFSDSIRVIYKNSAPSLSIDSPGDGQSFAKDQSSIIITGKTDPDVKVTVNDFWAIINDKGNYSYTFHLQNGDNQIRVDATDAAGNKTEKSIKVMYSQ